MNCDVKIYCRSLAFMIHDSVFDILLFAQVAEDTQRGKAPPPEGWPQAGVR